MEPNQNAGSFMGNAGGWGDVIMEALQRRGYSGNTPTTSQSSLTQAPVPQAIPQTNPSIPSVSPEMGANSVPISGMPPKSSESELIIRALSQKLSSLSKIEEASAIPPKPPAPGGI